MRYRILPQDFQVEEVIDLPRGRGGDYTLYRVRKTNRTTLEVQEELAAALQLPPAVVSFPALKDRQAVSVQYASVLGAGPAELHGQGWSAQRAGHSPRALHSNDLRGNRFTAVLRDLVSGEAAAVATRLEQIAAQGLPNYFDRQRFGSYSPGQEWVGKLILRGDAEGALKAHLGQAMAGDPEPVAAFKAQVREHWGEWDLLFQAAPRPSNFRSVLVFLKVHPEDYRRALNLVTPRVLSLYLAAYQSLLWNRMVGLFLRQELGAATMPYDEIEIVGEKLPIYQALSTELLASLRSLTIPLPHHRAAFPGEWRSLFGQALAVEGLSQTDLKARLLKKSYLGRGSRALLLFPQEPAALEPAADERFPGREKMTVSFALPAGAYATLILGALGEEVNFKKTTSMAGLPLRRT